ncbi:MAG: RNA 2',3'-cyclic phosphodiesterase [Acidobacteriota bacterium]|nr:RNA 2',3'-cyclic phosphodiesterase [Acidobacteriota bacterium]
MMAARSSHRLFVALALPPDVRQAVHRWCAAARLGRRGWRLVRDENLHLTLRFLGDGSTKVAEELGPDLERVTRGLRAPRLVLESWGSFGPRGKPRVIWVGVGGQVESLRALGERVEQCVRRWGFPPETRPLKPHLTVARPRRGERLHLPAASCPTPEPARFTGKEVALYESALGPGGPVYTARHRFDLEAADDS